MLLEREAKGTRNRSKAAKIKRLPGLALSGRTDAGVSAYGQVRVRAFKDAGASMRQQHPPLLVRCRQNSQLALLLNSLSSPSSGCGLWQQHPQPLVRAYAACGNAGAHR